MRNFWANFIDFEPLINIIQCKTEKLKQKTEYFNARLYLCSLYLGKANLTQKVCKNGLQSNEIFGQKFHGIYQLGKFALVKILEGTLVESGMR